MTCCGMSEELGPSESLSIGRKRGGEEDIRREGNRPRGKRYREGRECRWTAYLCRTGI